MKKLFKGLACVLALTTVFSAGVFASGTLETISAYLNHGITVEYNDVDQTMVDANGQRVIPITYNGSTYLPVRAISNMLGVNVGWDQATQTVLLGNSYPDVVAPVPQQPIPQQPVTGGAPSGNITSDKVDITAILNLIQTTSNGQLTLEEYDKQYISNGAWLGKAYESLGEYAYAFPSLTFVSSQGAGYEVPSFANVEKALTDFLLANGYTFVETDSFGAKYYRNGSTEFTIWNINGSNSSLQIEIDTKWLALSFDY